MTVEFQACHAPSERNHGRLDVDKKVTVSLKAFKSDITFAWGYEILTNKKVFIHQEFIPALEGKQPFESKRDALKVGRAVMQKIKEGKSPTLSQEEVEALLDMKK